jgi:hypothetical protein
MTHNTEDELLGFALEVLTSNVERNKVAAHLAECFECSLRLENVRRDIEIVGGVKPVTRALLVPSARPRALGIPGLRPHIRWAPTLRPGEGVTYAILKTAALIAIGVLLGLGASKRIPREPEFVSSSYVTLSPPTDSLTSYSISDATGIASQYYERLLEQRK